MKLPFAVLRFACAIVGAIAIVVTLKASVEAGTFDWTRFFGYFTIQGNAIIAIVLFIAAIVGLTGRKESGSLLFVRGAATSYIAIVGLVYNTLLSSADVGALVPWANSALHLWIPLYAALDWLLFADRLPLRWKLMPLVLVYPLIWTIATIVRGLVEKPNPFFPYPFLDPATVGGYGGVAIYCVLIAIAFAAMAAIVWWASRARAIKP